MADEAAHTQQYKYKTNSNSGLNSDNRYTKKRSRDEASGEMRDKYQRSKSSASKEEDERERRKKAKTSASEFASSNFARLRARSKMGLIYTPKTPETRQTYKALLKFIHDVLGDLPRDVSAGAADEILASLKNEKLKEKQKHKDIQSLLGSLSSKQFNILFNLSRKITDYKHGDKSDVPIDEKIDETFGSKEDLEEQEMLKLMGFDNFDSTKGKKVPGNNVSAVHVIHKRKYRQYMNRKGGFNRPLDFVA